MSTPTHARDADRATAAAVPQPRPPADAAVDAVAHRPSASPPTAPSEPVGVFGRYPWLTPVAGIACVLAVFAAMVLLNWFAGGGTPFDR
jgi:hypothetical protein